MKNFHKQIRKVLAKVLQKFEVSSALAGQVLTFGHDARVMDYVNRERRLTVDLSGFGSQKRYYAHQILVKWGRECMQAGLQWLKWGKHARQGYVNRVGGAGSSPDHRKNKKGYHEDGRLWLGG